MKLIYAIVRNDNEEDVTDALNERGYIVTKLSTTGGFLKKGNVTLMICTEDNLIDDAIDTIHSECGDSKEIQVEMPFVAGSSIVSYSSMPTKVAVGGATIFVTNVERFEKF